jgi:hypothetical protein
MFRFERRIMTKQEVKDNFGKMVRSKVRLGRKYIHVDKKKWVVIEKPIKDLLIGIRTYKDGTCGHPFYIENLL